MIEVGETALLLRFRDGDAAAAAWLRLRGIRPPGVRDLVPGADGLLVVFREPPGADDRALCAGIEAGAAAPTPAAAPAPAIHRVAVRYDGPDLAAVADRAGLHVDDVVARHAAVRYRVAFVGFQPGFGYLAGLPPALHCPRHARPRPRVPAGSIGIGGAWTGIYPFATPGGWQLIATAEGRFFDPEREPPGLFGPGDTVVLEAR